MNQQIYRIEIHSSDAQSGSAGWWDSYFFIDLATIIPQNYQYVVESFSMMKESRPYASMQISISYPQANTYSTNTKSQTTVVHSMSVVGINKTITTDTIGIPIPDVTMFRANRFRILLTNIDGTTTSSIFYSATQFWSMTLLIYPILKV